MDEGDSIDEFVTRQNLEVTNISFEGNTLERELVSKFKDILYKLWLTYLQEGRLLEILEALVVSFD